MNNFLRALTFLTIIPIKTKEGILSEGAGSAVRWFPAVGFCIGVFVSLSNVLFSFFFPPLITGALVIMVYIAITGALHLDGLADTCDGIWGGRNKEKRLEIMRDSRIGSFGAVGLICVLGLRYISLLSVWKSTATAHSPFSTTMLCISCFASPVLINTCVSLIIMPVIGRWAQVFASGLSSYARSESGTGSFVVEGTTLKQVMYTSLFPLFLFWFFYHLWGLLLFAIITIFTLIWIWFIKRKIGGMTGDTLGATNEVAELVFLLSLLLFS